MNRYTTTFAAGITMLSALLGFAIVGRQASASPPTAAPTPTSVQLAGTIKNLGPGFMPAAKNGGKTQGWVEVSFADWRMTPSNSGTDLKDFLEFRDDISIVAPPSPPASNKTGSCRVTLTGLRTYAATATLTVWVTEPGCDSISMLQETFPNGLHVRVTGVWKPTGASVPVAIDLAPKGTPSSSW